jgi:hypothetical protein
MLVNCSVSRASRSNGRQLHCWSAHLRGAFRAALACNQPRQSHGPITNLEMLAMTMVFRVANPQMLDTVKEGDKVRFAADKVNGAFTVTDHGGHRRVTGDEVEAADRGCVHRTTGDCRCRRSDP